MASSDNQLDRIERKLDLLLEHLGLTATWEEREAEYEAEQERLTPKFDAADYRIRQL